MKYLRYTSQYLRLRFDFAWTRIWMLPKSVWTRKREAPPCIRRSHWLDEMYNT